jgi:tetratricopeptide (TPR) repeat protein
MHAFLLVKMFFVLLVWLPLYSAANLNAAVPQSLSSQAALAHIRSLIKSDRLADAGAEIGRQLQQQSGNPDLQFLRCVVVANQKQVQQAMDCFSALVKAHPNMVEAYNNLGVLHASLGHHEEAKQWFDNGLRRVPALWTVHQNILNLQADLARKAYSRALQIEATDRAPQAKLSFLATPSEVVLTSTSHQNTKAASTVTTKPTSQFAASTASDNFRKMTPPPAQGNTSTIDGGKVPPPVKPPLAASAADKPQLDSTQVQVQQALEAWAKAWSQQNLSSYFGAYSTEFTPGKEVSHTAWKSERTARIVGRQFIRVAVSHVTFEKSSAKVIARFTQNYESDNLITSNRKRLDFVFEDGHWRIVREAVISNTP